MTYLAEVIADSPLSVYQLDEATGTVAADAVGGRPATLSGSFTLGATARDGGRAISFSGGDAVAALPPGLDGRSESFDGWVYIPSLPSKGCFTFVGSDSGGYGIGLGSGTWSSDGANVILLLAGVSWIDTGYVASPGWHHYALTIDASGHPSFYWDGARQMTDAGHVAVAPVGFVAIAGEIKAPDNLENLHPWPGGVDDVAIYNTQLSAARIAVHASFGAPPTYISSTINASTGAGATDLDLSMGISMPDLMVGDLLLAWLWCSDSSVTWQNPGGWTSVAAPVDDSNEKTALFYRIVDGSTPSHQVFSLGAGEHGEVVGQCIAYRNVHPTSPINVSASGSGPSGTDLVMPSVTTTRDGSLLVCIPSSDENMAASYGVPTGMTQRINGQRFGGSLRYATYALFEQLISPAGATGTRTTASNHLYGHSYFVLAIAPHPQPLNLHAAGLPSGEAMGSSHIFGPRAPLPAIGLPSAEAMGHGAIGSAAISKVRLSFYITHTYDSDLYMVLTGPDGHTSMRPLDSVGGSGDNFGTGTSDGSRTILDDAATTPIVGTFTNPFVGSYRPGEPFSVFNGIIAPTGGSWSLEIVDQYGGDVGTVRALSLFVTVLGYEHRIEPNETLPVVIPDTEPGSRTFTFGPKTLVTTGLPSQEALGAAVRTGGRDPYPVTGLPSEEAIGSATLTRVWALRATGIPTQEEFGVGLITAQVLLGPASFGFSPQLEGELVEVVVDDTAASAQVDDDFIRAWSGIERVEGEPPGYGVENPPAHLGVDIPKLTIKIRSGRFRRNYRFWDHTRMPVGATIADANNSRPWSPLWIPNSPYEPLPNVMQLDTTKNYDANGIGSATIQLENIAYPENEGGGHDIRRGFLSPLRGYISDELISRGAERPLDLDNTEITENDWYNKLDSEAQITIWETYGTAKPVKVFTGLIEDVDIVSRPDRITLTARSFGLVLSDERLFGWNKDPKMRDSIIFIDRDEAEDRTREGDNAKASSVYLDRKASLAFDTDAQTSWRSDHHTTPNATEWLEFEVPSGSYSKIFLNPNFEDVNHDRYTSNTLDIYVAIFARGNSSVDGTTLARDNWIQGLGNVPGTNVPYVKVYNNSSLAAVHRDLSSTFHLGDDSIFRIYFRGLPPIGDVHYAAGVTTAYATRESLDPQARKQHWVMVDDISDVVKVVLRWAGFKEWEIESTGTKLPKRLVYQRGSTYMDVIKAVQDIVGYTFFVGDPSPAGRSLGVPVFRKTFTLADNIAPKAVITDRTLLTAIAIKQTDENLAYNIRVRGRSDKHGKIAGSSTSDSGKRLMYLFTPPWIGQYDTGYMGRLGGVLKHLIYVNPLFKTIDLCRFAAYKIALDQILASVTASAEFPGYPGIDLDDHILLSDLGTGITTRLAIADRSSSFKFGEHTKWTTTVGGSLIDTKDVQDMVTLINNAVPPEDS